MRYSVEISDQAYVDVQVIYDWIAERAPAGAHRWYDAYQAALDKLAANADRYALAPESSFFSTGSPAAALQDKKGTALPNSLFDFRKTGRGLACPRSWSGVCSTLEIEHFFSELPDSESLLNVPGGTEHGRNQTACDQRR